jgi:hypothetical protein
MMRLVHFGFSSDRGISHHIDIVSDRCSAGLPNWHRKAGILPLHRFLAELAS